METFECLKQFYENYREDERLTSRHGRVEFFTTVRYVEKYLKEGMKLLEIGAGTGRYSHYFARRGYDVTAVELVPCNLEILKANTAPEEKLTAMEGNATDLSVLPSNSFDLTLLLGPMYHLFTEQDQLAALSEAIRVTKTGGIVFSAYCLNEATLVQFCFQKGMILKEPYKTLIDPITFQASSTPQEIFALYRKEDIDRLMSHFPVTRLHYVGTDMATNYMRECVDAMDDELFELYLRYHFSICERSDLVGASHHSLDVFRKSLEK